MSSNKQTGSFTSLYTPVLKKTVDGDQMQLIHYQTLEPVGENELRVLNSIRTRYNEGRGFWSKIKLWRKADVLEKSRPQEARWGWTRADKRERVRVLGALKEMSKAVPSLTWVVRDETVGREFVMRDGKLLGGGRAASDAISKSEAQMNVAEYISQSISLGVEDKILNRMDLERGTFYDSLRVLGLKGLVDKCLASLQKKPVQGD